MDSFSITQDDQAGTLYAYLNGALIREAAPEISRFLETVAKDNTNMLVIDLSGLECLSGEGLHLLTILLTKLSSKGRMVQIHGLSEEYRAIFNLTRLDKAVQESRPNGEPAAGRIEKTNQAGGDWAVPTSTASLPKASTPGVNLNVHRRALTSPVDSFGRMWLRTYRVALGSALAPEEVMAVWKERFAGFWPPGNSIYISTGTIQPGAVCLINLGMPMGIQLATGAVVIYANDTSFTLMTVQGHMFSGFITFSTYREGKCVYAQTQALIRPNDPFYEFSFRAGFGPKAEDGFWIRTMKKISTHFVTGNELRCPLDSSRLVEVTSELIDRRVNWRHFGNIWYNAGVRSGIYQFFSPLRRLFGRKKNRMK